MRRLRLPKSRHGVLLGNVAARVAALGCVFGITLLLAHDGGAAIVGVYALLHVLPGLTGTVVSSGLPIAAPYFLAGPDRENPRLPATLASMAFLGGVAGTALWIACAPLFGPVVFSGLPLHLVMFAGLAVLSRLAVITAKACSQGADDLAGSNAVIFTEQFMFLPAYGALWLAGVHGFTALIASLLLADCVTASLAWSRLARKGFFGSFAPPSVQLARRVAAYGMRGQVGGVMSQLNLRLDFILLTVLTGPAVLGVYAVASKFAELIRVLGMALQYVFYPKFARETPMRAVDNARRLLPRAGLLSASVLIPLWISAGFVIPAFYGSAFASAVTPTRIILLGLAFDGLAGVISASLYGLARPGLNSCAMGAGLVVTLVLDLTLIPRFGATGAAIASAAAYTTTTAALVGFFWWIAGAARARALRETMLSRAEVEREVRLDARSRIDILVGRVGVEVKVAGTSRVRNQLARYLMHERIDGVVLVTNRVRHQLGLPCASDRHQQPLNPTFRRRLFDPLGECAWTARDLLPPYAVVRRVWRKSG